MRSLATACVIIALAGCATPRGGDVRLAKGATTGDIDTGAAADTKAVKLDKTHAENLTVQTTYGALDKRVAQIGVIGFLVFLGLLLGAAGAPSPDDARLTLGLYVAAAVSFTAALAFAWRFFL